jgi:recombination DNA repair RAD52 pathway protein
LTEKKTKKTGWPKSRLAHSNEGRVGQAWRPGKVLKDGIDVFGNKKVFLVEEGHFRCGCGAIVRVDKNGFAACEECGHIYNDSPIRGTEYHMSKAKKKKALRDFTMSLGNGKI